MIAPGIDPAGRRSRCLQRAADNAVAAFCGLVRDELRFREAQLLPAAELRRYLRPLFAADGGLSPLGVAGYAARLRPVVMTILAAPPGLKILDAGCGYGTESYLFARLGAEVMAVELVPERAEMARSRKDFFSQQAPGSAPPRFINANILRFLSEGAAFDLIWAMESISHIFPPEDFLSSARLRLAPGGVLALSDPNKANPVAWLRAVLIRGSVRHSPHLEFRDPESGLPVAYGQEKIYSVSGMKRLLRRSGYAVDRISVAGFLGTTLLPAAWRGRTGIASALLAFQKAAGLLPLLRRWGSNYTILARSASPRAIAKLGPFL